MTQHPETRLVEAACSTCGATFTVRSTRPAISLDVCSNCHPAYTGRRRAVAQSDRIDRFNRRRSLATA